MIFTKDIALKNIKIIVLLAVVSFLFIASLFRLLDIQIVNAEKFRVKAKNWYWGSSVLEPIRGTIYDRKGRPFTMTTELNGTDKRTYPLGYHAGQIIGFVGRDGNGQAGIEKSQNRNLKGSMGWKTFDRINSKKKMIVAKDGENIHLTIDNEIQNIVDEELESGVKKYGAIRGTAIVSNPNTGEILAMSSYPFLDPNEKRSKSSANTKNLGISLVYEPGSIFKVIPAIIALEQMVYAPKDQIEHTNNKSYTFMGMKITDHHKTDRELTFDESLTYSSNIAFCQIGSKVGPKNIWEYALNFGIGSKTNLALPAEENGRLWTYGTRQWMPHTHLSMSIGYNVMTTPIQILSVYNTIANDGLKINPYIIAKTTDAHNKTLSKKEQKPYMFRRIGSESSFLKLKDMLQNVVDSGTAKSAQVEGVEVCGKTGTSEKLTSEGYSNTEHYTTFVGFLPKKNPELSCIVVYDAPDIRYKFASQSSAPTFQKIITRIINNYNTHFSEKIKKSIPKDTINIPDVVGMEKWPALDLLKKEGFKYQIFGDGQIIRRQSPKSGEHIGINKKITLILNNNDKEVHEDSEVPNLEGLSVRDAVRLTMKSGYEPFVVGSGIVYKQEPSSGDFEKGSLIKIYAKGAGQ